MTMFDSSFSNLRKRFHDADTPDISVREFLIRVFFALFLSVAALESIYGGASGNVFRADMGGLLFFCFLVPLVLSRRPKWRTFSVVGTLALLFIYIAIRIVFDVAEDNHSSIIESMMVGFVAPLMGVLVLGMAESIMVALAFALLLGGVTIWHETMFHAIPLLLAALDGIWVTMLSVAVTAALLLSHVLHRESERRMERAKQEYAKANEQLGATMEELRLQRNELQKFRLAIESVSEPIIITDKEGIIGYANRAMETVTGYGREELIGTRAGALWKKPMPDEFYKELWNRIVDEKSPFEGDLQNRNKNGTIYDAHLMIAPVLDAKGNVLHFVGLERDISKEKELERAKSRFVMLTSHQLKTPLTSLRWYIELLSDVRTGPLTEMQEKYVRAVDQSVRHMVYMVNVLLNISQIETKTFQVELVTVDLDAMVKDVTEELYDTIDRKKLHFRNEIARDAVSYTADQQLVRIVIENLLSNAVKYTPPKGTITLVIANRNRGESFGGRILDADSLLITVSDSGYGIPEGEKKFIFTSFFRAENIRKLDVEGNGLGLFAVKTAVESCGGTIWFDSEQGKGTTFYVTLPKGSMSTNTFTPNQ
jgi:PAS domain S-box-containing protein